MSICEQIISILNDPSLDNDSEELSKAETIETLIDKHGWAEIQFCLLQILHDEPSHSYWRTVAEVIYGAVLDERDLPADKIIALLYYRLPSKASDEDENLVWSITHKLKKVGYLSEYDPLNDPNVQREMANLRNA